MTDPHVRISAYFDGLITEADFARLCAWLREDVEHRQAFLRRAAQEQQTRAILLGQDVAQFVYCDESTSDDDNDASWSSFNALLEQEEQSVGSLVELTDSPRRVARAADRSVRNTQAPGATDGPIFSLAGIRVYRTTGYRRMRRMGWWLAAAAAIVVAALVLWKPLQRSTTTQPPVAHLEAEPATRTPVAHVAHSFAAKWDHAAAAPENGTPLHAEDRVTLTHGLLELHMERGAAVVLEAPCTFVVMNDNGVFLERGKLAAAVTPESRLFTVETPAARVLDLGTKFGVEVHDDGSVDVAVFEGIVELSAASEGEAVGDALRIAAAHRGRVDAQGRADEQVQPMTAMQRLTWFRRSLAHRVDVADVVAGGDGSQMRRAGGIDPVTGTFKQPEQAVFDRATVGDYIPVAASPYIDGVFTVPADAQPIQIAPDHRYTFPATAGRFYSNIWAGGTVPVQRVEPPLDTVIDGVDVSEVQRGFIVLLANVGVTFDLTAMRPAQKPAAGRFMAVVSNRAQTRPFVVPHAQADLWIFVDGEPAFVRRQFTTEDGSFIVDVELPADARYLTIACTDGQDSVDHDWIILAQPRIEFDQPSNP